MDTQKLIECNNKLLASEEENVKLLTVLIDSIVNPLNVKMKDNIKPEIKKIFRYLTKMQQFHSIFLSVLKRDESDYYILDQFIKYIGFIGMYDDYLREYLNILSIFASLQFESKKFSQFMNKQLNNRNIQNMLNITSWKQFPWCLYRPIDQIKSYFNFLTDLQNIIADHDDNYSKKMRYPLLKIKPIINRRRRDKLQFESKTKLLEIQLELYKYPKILYDVERIFISKQSCFVLTKYNKRKSIIFYIFNDLLLYIDDKNRFKKEYCFKQRNLEIIREMETKLVFKIKLKNEKKYELNILCETIEVYNGCITDINSAYNEYKTDILFSGYFNRISKILSTNVPNDICQTILRYMESADTKPSPKVDRMF